LFPCAVRLRPHSTTPTSSRRSSLTRPTRLHSCEDVGVSGKSARILAKMSVCQSRCRCRVMRALQTQMEVRGSETHKSVADDSARRRRRREQNRRAARKCREKKKESVDNMLNVRLTVFPSQHQWHNNRPCRPCNAGGPHESGGPCANPPQNFFSRLAINIA